MSSSLMWKPANPIIEGSLSYELKRTISRKLWDTDGSTGHGEAIVGKSLIPYLEGLVDAGIKGADGLIKLIEEHGEIILWHEH